MTRHRIFKLTTCAAACALLAACGSTGGAKPNLAENPNNNRMDGATHSEAQLDNTSNQSLPLLAKAYASHPGPDTALKYAAGLRESDSANKASVILKPYADDSKSATGVKTEYAAIELALGDDENAEKYARKAIAQDSTDAHAWHYLGIALDAQEKHPEAEQAFRKALDLWKGDPTPIMNNLALNLSAQGYLDEAAEILEKAREQSPDRVEIERNLRIITALRQSEDPTTPTPTGKRPSAPDYGANDKPPAPKDAPDDGNQ